MRDFKFIDIIKVHPKCDRSLPKFKGISWPNLLTPLQTAYFIKLSNLQQLITHLHLSTGVRIIHL